MKFVESESECAAGVHVLELTRRNLQALLAKLDDPLSERMLIAPGGRLAVKAVEDDEHYSDREAGAVFMPSSGEYR